MRMATSIAIFVVVFGALWLIARRWRRRAERGLRPGRVGRAILAVVGPIFGFSRRPKK